MGHNVFFTLHRLPYVRRIVAACARARIYCRAFFVLLAFVGVAGKGNEHSAGLVQERHPCRNRLLIALVGLEWLDSLYNTQQPMSRLAI